jgi:hypothetical protein
MGAYAEQFELYNMLLDPDEMINRAYDPDFKEKRDELAHQLKELERQKLFIR